MTKNLQAFNVKEKTSSKAIIKRNAEIGSPCLVSLSNLKYSVVLPPLTTHYSGLFIKIWIHFRNSLPNPNFLTRTSRKNN